MTYEQQLQQLETLIKQLENGDLSLDQTLAAYEQGVALIRACQQQLEQAEQRIQLLAHDANGEETLVPFVDPGDGQPGFLKTANRCAVRCRGASATTSGASSLRSPRSLPPSPCGSTATRTSARCSSPPPTWSLPVL